MQLMLLTKGQTRRIQKQAMLITALLIFCEAIIIHSTFAMPHLQTAILFVLAFFAFYTRRYGLHFVGIGLASLFAYMIFTFLMKPETALPPVLTAVALAGCIAFIVNFYFLPERPAAAYRDAVRQYMFCAYEATERLIALLRNPHASSDAEHTNVVDSLQNAYDTADSLSAFLPIHDNALLSDIQSLLNRVNGSFMMLTESIIDALNISPPINPGTSDDLIECLQLLREILSAETLVPLIDERTARKRTELLDHRVKALRRDLDHNQNLFSDRLFFLARATFCLRRLNTALHEWQAGRHRHEEADL
jgi:uncharacterized membrane protein YccC